MIRRPAVPRGRRVPGRRDPGMLAAAAATAATLVLSVVTVATVSGEAPAPASGDREAAQQHSAGSAPTPSSDPARRLSEPGHAGARGGSAAGSTGTQHSGAHKVFELAEHPLLRARGSGMRPAGCDLPRWRGGGAVAKEFFSTARQCLDEAWRPVLRRYNLPFHPPELHFPTGTSFSTQCGTIEIGVATAAYYCENDLYVPFAGLQTEEYGKSPGIYLALFAHEYAHHVQELSGIMDAAWRSIYRAGRNSQEGLEMSRRKELQAQCLSGMFMATHTGNGGSITQRMFENAWADQASRGDDHAGTQNHGSNAHYAYWWRKGARSNNLSACNTFAAPSSAVR